MIVINLISHLRKENGSNIGFEVTKSSVFLLDPLFVEVMMCAKNHPFVNCGIRQIKHRQVYFVPEYGKPVPSVPALS